MAITKLWRFHRGPGSSYRRQAGLLLIPFLLGTFILVALPVLVTLGIAFTRYQAIRPPTWAGLANFQRLFASPLVRLSLRNTFLFLVLAVPLRLIGALALALLLRQPRRLAGLYRAAVYLPTVIPEAAYALIWLWILNPMYGPLNQVLGALGVVAPAWLVNPTTAPLALVLMSLFQIGEGFVVLMVGRQSIPPALYESAAIDGAGAWQSFRRITLPLITPWLLLLTCRDIIMSLQNTFTPSFILAYGGPYYATTFIPLLVYEISFDIFDLGLASAMLVVAYVLIGLVIVGIYNIVQGIRGGGDET